MVMRSTTVTSLKATVAAALERRLRRCRGCTPRQSPNPKRGASNNFRGAVFRGLCLSNRRLGGRKRNLRYTLTVADLLASRQGK